MAIIVETGTDNSDWSNKLNNKGVTLIELLIYVALFMIVTLLVGSQLKNMVKNYSGGRRVSSIQTDARDVLAMMVREIKNTGFKTRLNCVNPNDCNAVTEGCASLPLPDNSSFQFSEGNPGDRLTIMKYNIDLGACETIEYFLTGTTLQRRAGGVTNDLAENVYALQFQYGVFAQDAVLLSSLQNPFNALDWDKVNCGVSVSGEDLKITVGGAFTGKVAYKVSTLNIASNERVWINFHVSAGGNFPANLTSLKWALRSTGGALLGSETFLPRNGENRIKMPVAVNSTAKLSLEFTSSGAGELLLKKVEVRRADLGSYTWSNAPTSTQKPAVKAIKIFLLTRTAGESTTKSNSYFTVGNISVTPSGNYSWRLYKDMVEIPNNGLF